jgi:hypothetical protein
MLLPLVLLRLVKESKELLGRTAAAVAAAAAGRVGCTQGCSGVL